MKLLSVKETASRLSVSEGTVRNLWRSGRLKGIRLGKLIRIHEESLLAPEPPKPSRRRRRVKNWLGD
jgi:excisionase family DNA binding protein